MSVFVKQKEYWLSIKNTFPNNVRIYFYDTNMKSYSLLCYKKKIRNFKLSSYKIYFQSGDLPQNTLVELDQKDYKIYYDDFDKFSTDDELLNAGEDEKDNENINFENIENKSTDSYEKNEKNKKNEEIEKKENKNENEDEIYKKDENKNEKDEKNKINKYEKNEKNEKDEKRSKNEKEQENNEKNKIEKNYENENKNENKNIKKQNLIQKETKRWVDIIDEDNKNKKIEENKNKNKNIDISEQDLKDIKCLLIDLNNLCSKNKLMLQYKIYRNQNLFLSNV